MIEYNTYYIEDGDDLRPYNYEDIKWMLEQGTIHDDTPILLYDNLTRAKRNIKACQVL